MTKLLFIFLFILFSFGLTIQGKSARKCHMTNVTCHSHISECHRVMSHDGSHDEYGKMVYRPYSSCISNIQEINKDSIEFFLSTWTWSRFKFSWLEPYTRTQLSTIHLYLRSCLLSLL